LMRLVYIPILFVLTLTPALVQAFDRDWPPVTVSGNPGVVVPRYEAGSGTWGLPSDSVDGFWLPGEPRLEEAEDAIANRAETIPEADRAPQLGAYRQYLGFMENGERKILVNAFCREFDNWRSEYVIVMDGGSCSSTAIYN